MGYGSVYVDEEEIDDFLVVAVIPLSQGYQRIRVQKPCSRLVSKNAKKENMILEIQQFLNYRVCPIETHSFLEPTFF